MSLDDLLERADAPHELVEHVRTGGLDFDAAWQAIGQPDHRLWLAACGGTPIELLIESAAAAVLTALDTLDAEGAEPLAVAVELAVAGGEPAELLDAAEECERLADGGVSTYRGAASPGYAAAARAAALVVRAAEGLAAGEAHREGARLERARATSAYLGVGQQIVLPADEGPTRLEVLGAARDPAGNAFSFSVAASAEALREAARALAARAGEERERIEEQAGRELDAVVRATIEETASGDDRGE